MIRVQPRDLALEIDIVASLMPKAFGRQSRQGQGQRLRKRLRARKSLQIEQTMGLQVRLTPGYKRVKARRVRIMERIAPDLENFW